MGIAAALGTIASFTAAEVAIPLGLTVHARALTPGEPVIVELVSPEPLSVARATLLGREIALASVARESTGGKRWLGFGVIALDDPAGPTTIEAVAVAPDGRPAAGRFTFDVAAKKFPEERLTVASSFVEPPPAEAARIARERERLAAIWASRRAASPPAGPFLRPVPGVPTSIFGLRRFFNDRPRDPHPGLDLRAATGTPVQASGPGLVVLAEELYYSGGTVIVDHGGGLFTVYAHLSRIDIAAGDPIAAGRTVGLSGATGRVTGPHLHWGAKIGDLPFDPQALLDERLFR